MSQLRFPLKDYLEDPVSEAALHRVAQRIDAPLPPRNSRNVVSFVFAGAATAGIAVAAISAIHSRRDAGPLAFADGHEISAIDARVRPARYGSRSVRVSVFGLERTSSR